MTTAVTATKKLHIFADHFGGPTVVAVLISPLAGAQAAFNVDRAPLFELVAGDFCCTTEKHNAVPFRFLGELTVTVLLATGGGETEGTNCCTAIGCVADVRICAQIAEKNNLVDGSHDSYPKLKLKKQKLFNDFAGLSVRTGRFLQPKR